MLSLMLWHSQEVKPGGNGAGPVAALRWTVAVSGLRYALYGTYPVGGAPVPIGCLPRHPEPVALPRCRNLRGMDRDGYVADPMGSVEIARTMTSRPAGAAFQSFRVVTNP